MDTPSTPQTSSESSNDVAGSSTQISTEEGSECGWRDNTDIPRAIFYMGDDDGKFTAPGFHRPLEGQKIKVGICAMAKKTNSKPMKEILGRLELFEHLQIIVFNEEMICDAPVEDWPVVDALVSFFSAGFPLQKAIEYKNRYKPFVVNDLEAQYSLKDRREVYKILVREGIAHPRYAVMNRDEDEKGEFDENEDAIEVNGVSFQRPFVEKPVNAEDHNIYIYFPVSAGGGCQRLFRKVGSRSSVYSSISRVRKTGSYIYEDFMPTDGTDVKVYTVGPDYAHAEARKSPALDGKVDRDKDGKEVRYPVILSAAEKMTARKVCLAFKQNVCGFDLLRTGGKSYVCDVNGFSFVKNSTKYYDDCANVLGTMIVRALAPQLHIPLILGAAPEDIPVVPTTSGSMMELRCVIAVIRHGDRTPKQKMKMEVKNKKFFELFGKYKGYEKGHLKLKKPKQLQEVLDIARDLLKDSQHDANPEVLEKKAKLRQLKLVLEMYEFSGINRKIQLKYQPNGRPPESSDDEYPKEPSLVLIVKWGGELTPAGKFQAEDLGKAFRTLYPGGQGEFETPGLGFLRLHSTFRHDLKIYASDEGRVQMTAAAFTKGLLSLEGELTPILVSMVKSANTNGLLDKEGEASKYQLVVKERMMDILNQDKEFTEEDYEKLVTTRSASLMKAVKCIGNPKKMCDQLYDMVKEITAKIKTLKIELKSRDLKLYHGESWELLIRRWAKLEKDYKLKNGNYDISKIPDIYDCIKYDLQHNQKTLLFDRAEELFMCSKALADIVIPQEYGITVEEKLHISQYICTPLMRKIHSDLFVGCQGSDEESTRLNSLYSKGVSSPERFVRTRLYFTSESHIHSLLNMLRYGGLCDELTDEQWKKAMDFLSNTPELNYMTQINIMMFEDPNKDMSSPERYHIELHFSPGAYTSSDKSVVNPVSSGYRTSYPVRQAKKQFDHNKKLLHDSQLDKQKPENVIAEESITEVMSVSDTSDMSKSDNPIDTVTDISKSDAVDTINDISNSDNTTDTPNDIENSDMSKTDVVNETADIVCENEKKLETANDSGQTSDNSQSDKIDQTESKKDEVAKSNDASNLCSDKIGNTSKATSPLLTSCPSLEIERREKEVIKRVNSDVESIEKDSLNFEESSVNMNPIVQVESERIQTDLSSTTAAEKQLKDVKNTDSSTTSIVKADVRNPGKVENSTADHIDEFLDEIFYEKVSDDEHSKTITDEKDLYVKRKDEMYKPKSPDPDIPEWDWEDTAHQDKCNQSSNTTLRGSCSDTVQKMVTSSPVGSPKSVSQPITITNVSPIKEHKRTASFESYEDKRSRSLEDRDDSNTGLAMMEMHYRTIHLPINKDSHHSFSSLLYLNPEAFKGACDCKSKLSPSTRPQSSPYSVYAFDGFNMVPSLKPLETLHNNLTMRDLDAFLSRATTVKFFTPVSSPMYGPTPLPSPRCPELNKAKSLSGPSLPSSSNSSGGPSSPVDFMNKVKMFINSSKTDQSDLSIDLDLESPQILPNQKSAPSHVTQGSQTTPVEKAVNQMPSLLLKTTEKATEKNVEKLKDTETKSEDLKNKLEIQKQTEPRVADTTDGLHDKGQASHQSAFRTVARSSSQRSSFHVTQVPEDSLGLNKNNVKTDQESKSRVTDVKLDVSQQDTLSKES